MWWVRQGGKLKIVKYFKRNKEVLLLKEYNNWMMLQKVGLAAGWRVGWKGPQKKQEDHRGALL